jgi:hypothetical protein
MVILVLLYDSYPRGAKMCEPEFGTMACASVTCHIGTDRTDSDHDHWDVFDSLIETRDWSESPL